MRMSRYIFVGILLGFILYKSEAVSWFRIYEMFRFQSFHMFGIIGSAIVSGIIIVYLIKRKHMKMWKEKRSLSKTKRRLTPIFNWRIYFRNGLGFGWCLPGTYVYFAWRR